MNTTIEPRLVARWAHPRGKATVELRAHANEVGARKCYTIRAQGSCSVLWLADDADAVAETERRIWLGYYTPDKYKTRLVRVA